MTDDEKAMEEAKRVMARMLSTPAKKHVAKSSVSLGLKTKLKNIELRDAKEQ